MQDKRIVHDFEKIQTNIKEQKEKKCLSLALTFINIKIWINFDEWTRRWIVQSKIIDQIILMFWSR